MKLFKTFIAIFALSLTLISPLTLAAEYTGPKDCPDDISLEECQARILNQIGGKSNYGQVDTVENAGNTLATKIGNVLTVVLGFLGVIFLFFVTYSGIQWMTAGGNEERISLARTRIIRATVGLVIIASAYALSAFIIDKLQ